MGSTERMQPPAVRERAPNERERHAGWALPEPRFHRQRHPQHVGTGATGVLTQPIKRSPACKTYQAETITFRMDPKRLNSIRSKHDPVSTKRATHDVCRCN